MKIIKILIFFIALGGVMMAQNMTDPKEIMKKARDQSKLSGMEAKTTLEINDGKGNQRIRETTTASRIFPDGTEKRTIIFLSPAEVKGTGILIYDYEEKEDNMWIFMPALRKSRKIVSSEKSKNFMGSEFSNSDLSVGTIDDFTYAMDGTETIDQQPCWKIKIIPATPKIAGEYGVSSKTTWVSQKDFMPRKTIYMDPEGKLWKELYFSGIKLMDAKNGKYFISKMEIKNLKNGRSSKMEMTQMTFNPSIRDDIFTLAYIEKQ